MRRTFLRNLTLHKDHLSRGTVSRPDGQGSLTVEQGAHNPKMGVRFPPSLRMFSSFLEKIRDHSSLCNPLRESDHLVWIRLIGRGYQPSTASGNVVWFFLGKTHSLAFVIPQGIGVWVINKRCVFLFGTNRRAVFQKRAILESLCAPSADKLSGVSRLTDWFRFKQSKVSNL